MVITDQRVRNELLAQLGTSSEPARTGKGATIATNAALLLDTTGARAGGIALLRDVKTPLLGHKSD